MKTMLAIMLLVASQTSEAVAFYAHGFSYHLNHSDYYNANNLGLGIAKEISPTVSVEAGTYFNSYRKDTNYLGVQHDMYNRKNIKAGVSYSVLTGYEQAYGKKYTPVIAAHVEILRLRAIIVPTPYNLIMGFSVRY